MQMYRSEVVYHPLHVKEDVNFQSPESIASFFRKNIIGPIEKMACIFLNTRNSEIETMYFHEHASGTVSQCAVYPRKILECAILNQASRLVICHNHPSGNLTPSPADDLITQRIKDAAKFIDIELLDHLIITENAYFSYQENYRL